ncbi:hypothetical protein POTOM_009863 [Populus tomentosa]|uniref:Uncharacterized protein n=1 Tax=Populus tomentosa TaxID=118781 RepID=A0A8X8DAI0_POPTO|nr:hypothetical protein POTOM_009863 [Populus tomentosa]
MGGHGAVEVAKTVIEVADVAWKAMEFTQHHHLHENHQHEPVTDTKNKPVDEELESLRSENKRLRNLLEQNLKLLQNLAESPCLLNECPTHLYSHLVATVDSENFLTKLKSLQQASINETGIQFPFKEATGDDMQLVEVLISVDNKEPSRWVWVTEDMVPSNTEERSGIDDENYVVVTEENVVDGVAYFMAKCLVANPKAQKLTPEELQKILAKALGGVSKLEKVFDIWHAGTMFYTLGTWGLALAGLYRSRSVLRLAAKGIRATSKVVLKAL